MKLTKTKVLATIGPACSSPEILEKMVLEGMNLCRLNFSHGTYDQHFKVIQTIRQLSVEMHKPIGILLDLQGPKIRTGEIINDHVKIETGQSLILTTKHVLGDEIKISVDYPDMPDSVTYVS